VHVALVQTSWVQALLSLQSLAVVHPTQTLCAQSGMVPPQSLLVVHWTQLLLRQMGVPVGQSPGRAYRRRAIEKPQVTYTSRGGGGGRDVVALSRLSRGNLAALPWPSYVGRE
jgi:hypothetical protein